MKVNGQNSESEWCSTQDWTGNAQGREGHINFGQEIELKREQREDLVRKVNETAMGIQPSSSSEMKNSNSRAVLSSSSRH
jgi:hypothetical protein